jgi:hypothetical protein
MPIISIYNLLFNSCLCTPPRLKKAKNDRETVTDPPIILY